jgi:hypothetical protein
MLVPCKIYVGFASFSLFPSQGLHWVIQMVCLPLQKLQFMYQVAFSFVIYWIIFTNTFSLSPFREPVVHICMPNVLVSITILDTELLPCAWLGWCTWEQCFYFCHGHVVFYEPVVMDWGERNKDHKFTMGNKRFLSF